jgi:hypothetical protein
MVEEEDSQQCLIVDKNVPFRLAGLEDRYDQRGFLVSELEKF